MVLAGGEGTRLRPLTYATPKPLLPIANRPFLEHQLAWLATHGIDEVVLSVGYRPDAFVAHFTGGSFAGVELRYAVEPEPLGTGGAIRFAATSAGISERFVVCNGDVLTDLDVTALVRFHDERGAQATISLTQVEDPSAFGVVPTAPDGRVLAFVEKPAPGAAPTDWVNAGTYVLEASVLDAIPAGRAVSIERETFPALLAGDGRLYALPSPCHWFDIGTPDKYLQANAHLLTGHDALVASGAVVAPDATVTNSVVGAGAEIGPGASLLDAVVLEGARIAAKAVVHRSVVGPGARVGEGAVVEDVSVVGPQAEVPPGTHLAGARVQAADLTASPPPAP